MRRGDGGSSRASGSPGGRLLRLVFWPLGVVLLLLGLAQIFLPKIAANKISSRVGRYGSVDSVHVSAWPAIELLWGHADSVTVHASRLRLSPAQTGKLLEEAHGVKRMDLTSAGAQEGPLTVSQVSFQKRGSQMSASAFASQEGVAAALPPGFGVQLLGSQDGQVEVRASGGLFGIGASVDAVAGASEGKLVVSPRGFLLEALKLTLFSNPHVYVEGVSAAAETDDGGAAGYRLGMRARLR